jgi:hypothetical protein
MKLSLRSVVVVVAVLGGLLVACTPQTVGTGSVTFDIDGYCRLEAKVGEGGGGSYLQVRYYGVWQGPGPYEGCFHWTWTMLTLITSDGSVMCENDTLVGGEGECLVVGSGAGAWLQAQRTGDLVQALVTVKNQTTDETHNYQVFP